MNPPKPRVGLSADSLLATLRRRFEEIADARRKASCTYSMSDALMSAFAMFATKEPSMLSFKDHHRELHIEKPFGMSRVPRYSQMREILDAIDTEPFNQAFADLFWEIQRSGELKRWHFDEQYYLVVIDGSGHFCSDHICCPHCLVRSKNGKDQYYHQVVAAVLVHPETRQVIPLAVEPIIRSDGDTKNDCERNANKRLFARLRKLHPRLNLLIIEDGLSSNAPHIADLKAHNMHFLLGAKPGDHQHLYGQAIDAMDRGEFQSTKNHIVSRNKSTDIETRYVQDLPLNKSNSEVRVNFFQYFEFDSVDSEVVKCFSWVTDIDLADKSHHKYQGAGRCRWRLENETFNTLKNQGYHLEHNYGHGQKNLATVLALLMFLAFTVDQIQEACCGLFNAAIERFGRRIRFWELIRSHLRHFVFASFADLYRAIATGRLCKPPPV